MESSRVAAVERSTPEPTPVAEANVRAVAFGGLLLACSAWSIAPILTRLAHEPFQPHTFTVTRFAIACIPLVAMSLRYYPRDLVRAFRRPSGMVPIALLNIAMQYMFIAGVFGTTATTAQLVTKLSVVFVIVFSYFLYREERSVILSPLFLLGTLVSFGGVTLVLTSDPATMMPQLTAGSLFLLGAALCWGVYNVWCKHLVADLHPVPMFTVLAVYTTIGYIPIVLAAGGMPELATIGWTAALATILAGVIPLGMGHPSYNFAQKHLGASFCSSFTLSLPVFTYAFSFVFLPNESLLPSQVAGGVVLLLGTVFVTVARRRTVNPAPDEPVE